MNKNQAVEAFRLAVKAEHESHIPDNASGSLREQALATGDLISRLSADHLNHWFHIYEDIFSTYLTDKQGASKVKAPNNKE